jgi:hypothetical protein
MRSLLVAAFAALALLTGCPDSKVPKDPTRPPTPKALGAPAPPPAQPPG